MYLLIDNSGEAEISLRFFENNEWGEKKFAAEIGLLNAIHEVLSGLGQKLGSLKGIGVVVGKGRFTATRVATTIANTLAYALKIPVAGVSKFDQVTLVNTILAQPVGKYLLPAYSGEANIGIKIL